jgi:DNA helicase HerA-like ATPase
MAWVPIYGHMRLGTRILNNQPITLSTETKRQHSYVIGASGTGKTNFLLSLMAQERSGFCFIDKHGDAAKLIADSRRCIYWRPADLEYPIGLNPLQAVPPDERWKVTADITAIFSDIWGLGTETPRLLYYLRATIRLLLDEPGTTLLDMRRIFSDDAFRSRLLRKCSDGSCRQTWIEFNAKPAKDQSLEVGSLQNKVAALADPLPLRLTIGQRTSTIDIQKIIDTGQVLIVDLSGMGDEPAHLLGAFLVSQFAQAAERRAAMTEQERRDFTLYIDEFQNFASQAFTRILSESRKWRLSLILAHQFLSQLPDAIAASVIGNCATLVSFRVGADDAPLIGKAIDTEPQALKDLAIGEAWVRTLIDGEPSDAMKMKTEKTALTTEKFSGNVRHTRARYARLRSLVEHPKQKRPVRRGWGNG